MLAKRGSQKVYITILKLRKWLTINCVVNVVRNILPGFYIFKKERIKDDYIKKCKLGSCMAM